MNVLDKVNSKKTGALYFASQKKVIRLAHEA